MSVSIDHLRNRISAMEESELLKMAITNSHEYQPVALGIAREELNKRGYIIHKREDDVVVTKPDNSTVTLPKPPSTVQETEAAQEVNDPRPGLTEAGLLLLGSVIIGVFLNAMDHTGSNAPQSASPLVADLFVSIGLLRKNGFFTSRERMRIFAIIRMVAAIIFAAWTMSKSPTPEVVALGSCYAFEALGYLLLLFNPIPSTIRLRIGIGVCLLGILSSSYLELVRLS